MLTFEEARKIGLDACAEKLGRNFVRKYAGTSSTAYGDAEDHVYCFIGVSDQPRKPYQEGDKIILSSAPEDQFPYMASCNVWYENGKIEFLECILPAT
nr:hypothetical protein [uncultured Schaedlerella sp.]